MPGAGDCAGAGILPCQTENRARCTRYQSGMEAIGVGLFEDLWGEAETVVVVVGCQEREIAQGRVINRISSRTASILVVGVDNLRWGLGTPVG
jgi:hypothetical protein